MFDDVKFAYYPLQGKSSMKCYDNKKPQIIIDNKVISNQPVDFDTYNKCVLQCGYTKYRLDNLSYDSYINDYYMDSKYIVIKAHFTTFSINYYSLIDKKLDKTFFIIPYDEIFYNMDEFTIYIRLKTNLLRINTVDSHYKQTSLCIYNLHAANIRTNHKHTSNGRIQSIKYNQWCEQFRIMYMCLKWRNRNVQCMGNGVIHIILSYL